LTLCVHFLRAQVVTIQGAKYTPGRKAVDALFAFLCFHHGYVRGLINAVWPPSMHPGHPNHPALLGPKTHLITPGQGNLPGNLSSSVAQCAEFCSAAGFKYLGLEYQSDCKCGNDIFDDNVARQLDGRTSRCGDTEDHPMPTCATNEWVEGQCTYAVAVFAVDDQGTYRGCFDDYTDDHRPVHPTLLAVYTFLVLVCVALVLAQFPKCSARVRPSTIMLVGAVVESIVMTGFYMTFWNTYQNPSYAKACFVGEYAQSPRSLLFSDASWS
jgi:hypothetical protein